MKKVLIIFVVSLSFVSCKNENVYKEKAEEYLTFSSMKMNTTDTASKLSCVLYSDSTAKFSFDDEKLYVWEDLDSGFIFKSGNEIIHTNFDKISARHYFFFQHDGNTYKFAAKDSSYTKKMSNDYKPFFEEMAKHVFSGNGITSGEHTTGTISFIDDENKNVYYAPRGMSGIDTNYLRIGSNWDFNNDTYSFSLDGQSYQSTFLANKGHAFVINDIEYILK